MKETGFSRRWMIFFLALAVYTGAFAYRGVLSVDIMESRNYITAREIVQDGSWLKPTLNGELRIAKPPVPTWLTAVVFNIAGTDANLSANRLPSALAGLLLLVSAYFISLFITKSRSAAYYSVIVLSTSYLFFYMTRRNTWDIYSQSFMTASIASYCSSFQLKRQLGKVGMYTAAGVFAALSFMSKGPVAFYTVLFPFLIAGFYYFRLKPVNYTGLFVFLAVAAALSLLWPLYIYFNETHSALNTASAEISAWADRHIKPFWYYIKFPLMSGLWSVFLLPLLVPWFASARLGKRRAAFYLTWLFITLVLLSVIPEKKDRYLLPVIIPASLMIGEYVSLLAGRLRRTSADSVILGVWGGAVFSFGLCALGISAAAQIWFTPYNGLLFIIAATATVYCAVRLAISICSRETEKYISLSAVLFCLSVLLAVPAVEAFMPEREFKALEQVRKDEIYKHSGGFYGSLGIKEIRAVGRKVRPVNEFVENGGESAVLIVKRNLKADELDGMGLKAEYLKTYSSGADEKWNFYLISRKEQ
jgi:4-amino-4-deoxy-L-arabinose transferase-like glycosyltransferase